VFVLHIRAATWGADCPMRTRSRFSRTWGRRDWLMAHAGSLDRKPTEVPGPFEPVGSTDTEAVFCGLLNRFVEYGWRSLAEIDLDILTGGSARSTRSASLTCASTDGRDLLVHADRPARRCTSHAGHRRRADRVRDVDLEVDLTGAVRRAARARSCAASRLVPKEGDAEKAVHWRQLAPARCSWSARAR